MSTIGAPELLIVLLIVLLVFGSTRLPKLARSIGEAAREFKKGTNEETGEVPSEATTDEPPTNERVTMTRSELDDLLAEREARARRDQSPPA